jgi:hypothetical protein
MKSEREIIPIDCSAIRRKYDWICQTLGFPVLSARPLSTVVIAMQRDEIHLVRAVNTINGYCKNEMHSHAKG